MEKLISAKAGASLLKLGLYQIAGGATGLIIMLWSAFESHSLSGEAAFLYLIPLVFLGYSILCGILCIKGKGNALLFSMVNQIAQLMWFAVLGVGFNFAAGLYLVAGLDLTNAILFVFDIGLPKFGISFNVEPDQLEVKFNLVAIALLYWIDKLMKKAKEEEEIQQLAVLGEN